MANEVRKVPDRSRYELLVDGQVLGIAVEDYLQRHEEDADLVA